MRQVKGGWRFHGVKHLSAKANEPGFHSEDQDKLLGSMNLNVLNSDSITRSTLEEH